ncbi:MAG: response regulator [Deltaproteobacteria bacterium]|nr:response regulator [Deltaproteobacteria bacterium]
MNKKKILVVDDEDYVRELMQTLLKKMGYEVTVVESSEDALGLIEKEYFPVIITDLLLMGIDGVELAEILQRKNKKSKVFALSGHIDLYDSEKLKNAGFSGLIKKPIDIGEIKKIIEESFTSV